MNNLEQGLLKKNEVEIRELSTTEKVPYLLLLITEENNFSGTSTNDIEFYKMYKKGY